LRRMRRPEAFYGRKKDVMASNIFQEGDASFIDPEFGEVSRAGMPTTYDPMEISANLTGAEGPEGPRDALRIVRRLRADPR
jgi:hypothetical protein